MTRFVRSVAVTALLCLLAMARVFAQQAEAGAAKAPEETPQTKAIPAAHIADRALETTALLRDAAKKSDVNEGVQGIQDDFSAKKEQIEELQREKPCGG